jgi:hypothetical protein
LHGVARKNSALYPPCTTPDLCPLIPKVKTDEEKKEKGECHDTKCTHYDTFFAGPLRWQQFGKQKEAKAGKQTYSELEAQLKKEQDTSLKLVRRIERLMLKNADLQNLSTKG